MRRGGGRPAHRLAPSGRRARDRRVPRRDERRPRDLRLRADVGAPHARCRSARARRRARRPAPPAALAHPPRPRRGGRGDRPRAPARPGARLGDRRSAPRGSVTARGERAQAVRQRVRRALGRARPRARRRTSASSATGSSVSSASPSPGHASHHVCFAHEDGTLYAGDAAGVRIAPSRLVLPPTPPPDIDVVAWYATIDELERRAPKQLALVHFGVFDDVGSPSGRAARAPGRVGADRRGRCDAGRVRRARARRARRARRRRSAGGRARDADVAVLRRAEALGREGQAHPVTSHRFRVKRTPSATRRTQIRTSSADQTPTMPQSSGGRGARPRRPRPSQPSIDHIR